VVQSKADAVGRELLSNEISDLFEKTYFLKENPRFTLVDYTISADRSSSPAPPTPGKTQDTKNMKRRFEGVISVDGEEHQLKGIGNGPISSLANALSSIGIELDVQDYKEHAIGKGKGVKAVSYIECTAAGSAGKVWGVGIHEDVVQSSLIALLSAASNVSRFHCLFIHRVVKIANCSSSSQAGQTLLFHSDPAARKGESCLIASFSQSDVLCMWNELEGW
jgi:2-isopropylmalate synthase